MGYTTTLAVIAHTLHAHVDRCMQTEDVACQIMRNDLQRAMREWLCTSKAEMTREAEARSWDETTGNVWHRLATCDHLLDTDSWKHGEPPQGQGISFATATRHLRILKRRIEEIMGTSARYQNTHCIWKDISKEQWELLWSGETALRRYGAALWAAGHKTVNLLPDMTAAQTPHIIRLGKPTRQHEPSGERPIMDLLNRIFNLARDSTNPFPRHWQTNTKPYPRTIRNCSTGRARRYKAHNGTRHTPVLVNRDPNGRTVERRTIPRRRSTHTMYARTTNRVASSNGSHKKGPKGNRKYHPILAYLSHKRQQYKKERLPDLPDKTNGHM
jgi:hypothetical protein